ncbi:MAG TPA: CopG family transcriptional regulator [Ruminococcus sp.]|nr:CopG family transcriptional regulator [Ruminococcus sp.]
MEKRIAVIGIIIEDLNVSEKVNDILHEYSSIIIGRMGVPYKEKNISVISVIADAPADVISAVTGKLGKINGVYVKSAISKK